MGRFYTHNESRWNRQFSKIKKNLCGKSQRHSGLENLRGRLISAHALAAGGVRHGVASVEHDGSIEIRSQQIDDLADARNSFLTRIGA
jgi:hypothetical protein